RASAGEGCSQRSYIVGNRALTSKTPSALTATTDGPPTSGRQTRAARVPEKPSSGKVIFSMRASEVMIVRDAAYGVLTTMRRNSTSNMLARKWRYWLLPPLGRNFGQGRPFKSGRRLRCVEGGDPDRRSRAWRPDRQGRIVREARCVAISGFGGGEPARLRSAGRRRAATWIFRFADLSQRCSRTAVHSHRAGRGNCCGGRS